MRWILDSSASVLRICQSYGSKRVDFLSIKRILLSVHVTTDLRRFHSTTVTNAAEIQPKSKTTIYKYNWIKHLRFISRVKILHVLIVSGLTGPMCFWYTQGIVSTSVVLATITAATATTGGLFALSYFFRRVIGELAFDQSKDELTISALTFWGKRREVTIPLSDVVPLSDHGYEDKQLFHRLELYGSDFAYLLNLRHCKSSDRKTLFHVLGLGAASDKSVEGSIQLKKSSLS